MTTKCTGLMGRIFGHKWLSYAQPASRDIAMLFVEIMVPKENRKIMPDKGHVCQRCGAVTGGQDGKS